VIDPVNLGCSPHRCRYILIAGTPSLSINQRFYSVAVITSGSDPSLLQERVWTVRATPVRFRVGPFLLPLSRTSIHPFVGCIDSRGRSGFLEVKVGFWTLWARESAAVGLDVAYDGGRRRGMEVGGIGMLSSGDTFFDLEMVFVFF
jgi:hypothetical protein